MWSDVVIFFSLVRLLFLFVIEIESQNNLHFIYRFVLEQRLRHNSRRTEEEMKEPRSALLALLTASFWDLKLVI